MLSCFAKRNDSVSNKRDGDSDSQKKDRVERKVAFVLSGGANRGALQVGALLALLEHNVRPRILVGTSIGAVNAAFLAINPTLDGARWLERIWREASWDIVTRKDYVSALWRLLTGRSSLYRSKKLKELLEAYFPQKIRLFSDIKAAELYITAVDLKSGELRVFGRDKTESVIDAIMASSALPIVLEPWRYEGRAYVDGGVVSDLPVRVAVEEGATELYAIDIGPLKFGRRTPRGLLRVVGQTLDAVISHQVIDEMSRAGKLSKDAIHYINVEGFENVRIWDFGHTDEMIARGRQVGLEHLRKIGLI
jgi:NTE family protein